MNEFPNLKNGFANMNDIEEQINGVLHFSAVWFAQISHGRKRRIFAKKFGWRF
jgi:hypothetical protein